ncbi:MAG: tetratricopeptide repeat protein [Bdellovibrionales bacterium]|nr:tetratricopeptide repeat protein [Bdellovibrionales bacterium]
MKHFVILSLLLSLTMPVYGTEPSQIAGQTKKKTTSTKKRPAKKTKAKTKSKAKAKSKRATKPKASSSKLDTRAYKRYEDKSELSRALSLAKSQQYADASRILFDLSRNPKYRAERDQIRYILGIMLFEMGLYQSAGYQFVSVVRQGGSRYTDKSLEKLSTAADILNDRTLLNYSMSKVNLDKFPKEQRDMLRFRVGEYQYEGKQFDKSAHNFSRVSKSSPYYSKAKYMEGLSQAEMNQLQDALNSFNELQGVRDQYGVVDTNRVAAMLGKARIYYQNRSWEKAIEAYREIPRDSFMWHDALFEMSWALMRSAKLRSVLSNFQSLHSPYYEDAYIPESLLLRGIVYLYICQYEEMNKTLDLFGSIYKPVSNKLKKFLSSRPRPDEYYSQQLEIMNNFKMYNENQAARSKLSIPFIVGNKVSQEGDFQGTEMYIQKLKEERETLNNLPADWRRSAVGTASIKLVGRRIKAAERRAGLQIKRHLIEINRELDKLIEQSDFAKYEMLNAKKEGIKKTIGLAPKENTLDENVDREFFIQNGYEYWPFQGEYWLDELGNYHYLGKQSCE